MRHQHLELVVQALTRVRRPPCLYTLRPAFCSMSTPPPSTFTRPKSPPSQPSFSKSPVPTNPLGEGNYIRTAAALIIGDEILNGKTLDRNSNFFARFCFENGIQLKRIEIIPDDEDEIIEASRRMVGKYDFVITSGGIGPTHDDITYASLAKSFNQNLVHHSETLRRLDALTQHRKWVHQQTPQQREATRRMALFPERAEVIFIDGAIWVPVVRLEGKLCVFPGIPSLFQKMLTGLTPYLPLPPAHERPTRIQVFTERPESMIAPYLTSLQSRLKPRGIQIGSYPVLGRGVFVSLIGREPAASSSHLASALSSVSITEPTPHRQASPAPVSVLASGPSPTFNADPYALDIGGGPSSSSPPLPVQPASSSSPPPPPLPPVGEPATPTLMEIALEIEMEIGGRIVSEEEVVRCREEGGSFLSKRDSNSEGGQEPVHKPKC